MTQRARKGEGDPGNGIPDSTQMKAAQTMSRITLAESRYLLDLISSNEGYGYSDRAEVGRLQAKLSIYMELGVCLGDDQKHVILPKTKEARP